MFLKNYFNGVVPPMDLAHEDKVLVALVARELRDFNKSLDGMRYVCMSTDILRKDEIDTPVCVEG